MVSESASAHKSNKKIFAYFYLSGAKVFVSLTFKNDIIFDIIGLLNETPGISIEISDI